MKITVSFSDTNVIVPCGDGTIRVYDFIQNSIQRYKKATQKPLDTIIKVHKLKTKRDGGILDQDDILKDVVEDKELLIAIFDEFTANNDDSKHLLIHLNEDMSSNYEEVEQDMIHRIDKYTANSIRAKSGSESCLFKMDKATTQNDQHNTQVNNNDGGEQQNSWTISRLEHRRTMNDRLKVSNNDSVFNRFSSTRQSKLNNHDNTVNGLTKEKNTTQPQQSTKTKSHNHNLDTTHVFKLQKCNGALGIHVIPTYDTNNHRDMGLIIQKIEPNGRVYKDGRLRVGDLIIEINNKSLIGVDFLTAQEILRESMKENELDLKVVRELDEGINNNHQPDQQETQMENGNIYANLGETNENGVDYYSNEDIEPQQISVLYSNHTLNSNKVNLNSLNTKKMGKKIHVQLIKGPQGLGFKLASRDNPTGGEISPIYIKNILPKGAAIADGRLQRGDRLLEVNGVNIQEKTLNEAVNILRTTKLGTLVDIVVSRQMQAFPRELQQDENVSEYQNLENVNVNGGEVTQNRELLTFEIALNDTGSAGLGVSVKGKTKKIEDNDQDDLQHSIDLGIFIKTVINGGAASKDGRLKSNDQLININGFSLLGKSNEEAMQILREAMLVETRPGFIQLTVSRKFKSQSESQTVNDQDEATVEISSIKEFNNRNGLDDYVDSMDNEAAVEFSKRAFSRDAPTRRSMSEKRKIYNDSTRSNEFYSKIKINKMIDDQVTKSDNNILHNGSFDTAMSKQEIKMETETPTRKTPNKTNLIIVQQQKTNNVQALKQNYLQLIDSKNSNKLDNNKPQKPQTPNNQHTRLNNIIKNFQTNQTSTLKKSSKSNSIESIPSLLSYRNNEFNKNNNNKNSNNNNNKQLNGNSNLNSNSKLENQLTLLQTNESDNLPLTNIVNRQRTINRSFRTAVDKSFDIPLSDSCEDFYANRLNHLRMSSQSDDMRNKNKKSKKGIIETFQNLFKSNNKRNESKYSIELLAYQKHLEATNESKQHIKDLQENYLNSIKKFNSIKEDYNRSQLNNKNLNENGSLINGSLIYSRKNVMDEQ